MGSLEFSKAFGVAHASLAGRLAGVSPSLFPDRHILLGDIADREMAAAPNGVTVSRGDKPAITVAGSRFSLTYADPASDASFAALVALLCGRRAPVAADPESLSVLALAGRIAQPDAIGTEPANPRVVAAKRPGARGKPGASADPE